MRKFVAYLYPSFLSEMAFLYEKCVDNEEEFKKELLLKLKNDDYFEPSCIDTSTGCKGVFLKKGSIAYIEVHEKEEDKEYKSEENIIKFRRK